ncbi:sugar phosphate isomerase/epimerase family protein [Streptomyces bluensis]|uniref:sugar phosphate isomerase/epimerase family protein n=1 Tax=Streptomyces bluensis TaxID=33897 RepID=UPI00331DD460
MARSPATPYWSASSRATAYATGPVLPAPLLVDPDTYRACLDGLDERLEAMAALGCTVATTVLNPRSPLATLEARALARERIAHLADAAETHGVRLAVEAVSVRDGLPPDLDGPHPVADSLPALDELLHETKTGNAGVLADSFHWAAADRSQLPQLWRHVPPARQSLADLRAVQGIVRDRP